MCHRRRLQLAYRPSRSRRLSRCHGFWCSRLSTCRPIGNSRLEVTRNRTTPKPRKRSCCPDSTYVPVKTGEMFWRHPRKIEGLDEEPTCHCCEQPVLPPTPVGDPNRLIQVRQFPGTPQTTCEFVILHDRP